MNRIRPCYKSETPRSGPADAAETRYTMQRLEIESVVVTDATGAEPVTVADLLAARPDPFCEIESTCSGT